MTPEEILMLQFLETVDQQIKDNDPVETRQTLARLKKEGYSTKDCKMLIAQCVAAETFRVIQNQQAFDNQRYIECLAKLPEFPEMD